MEKIKILAQKFLNGTATDQEKQQLHDWYASNLDDDTEEEVVFTLREENKTQVKNRLYAAIWQYTGAKENTLSKMRYRLWPRIAIAAAAVLAIATGIYFFKAPAPPDFISGSFYVNDVAPGKNTATITLANGKTIQLSEAKTGLVVGNELKYNDGSFVRYGVRSLSTEQLLTASTPRGGQYQITLADGTKVWLNADSKISFPSKFSGNERKIFLNGEAYFEVATSYVPLQGNVSSLGGEQRTKQSFIVVTASQQVKVLGTHFNINSYTDEGSVRTTLIEGSVKVSSLQSTEQSSLSNTIILKPGQQSILNGEVIKVAQVDPELSVAWKNGLFYFKKTPLEQVMRQVSRWYDVNIVYQNEWVKQQTIGGTVTRYGNVSEILKAISTVSNVKFEVRGKTIIAK